MHTQFCFDSALGFLYDSPMLLPKLVSFLLWSVAAFCAVGWGLHMPSTRMEAIAPLGDMPSISYQREDLQKLFTAHAQARTVTAHSPQSSAPRWHLDGIVFSNDPALSRAMVQVTPERSKAYALGGVLPDGAKLQRIGQRHIEVLHNGHTQTVQLLTTPAAP